MDLDRTLKEIILGTTPLGAGVYLFEKNIFISIGLIIFGCIITSLIVGNYLEREKVMRRHLGYGHLKK